MGGTETAAAAVPAFLDWFQTYGQVWYVAVNMLYWIVVAAAVVFAAIQAKRYVDFVLGVTPMKAREPKPEAAIAVEIEDFVD